MAVDGQWMFLLMESSGNGRGKEEPCNSLTVAGWIIRHRAQNNTTDGRTDGEGGNESQNDCILNAIGCDDISGAIGAAHA